MKIHIKDNDILVEDYPHSPHIRKNIEEGKRVLCGIGVNYIDEITEDINYATCKGCMIIFSGYTINYDNK